MIVGIYPESGDPIVLPLDQAAQRVGKSEYFFKQCLDGKAELPHAVVVNLPPGSVFRDPGDDWRL